MHHSSQSPFSFAEQLKLGGLLLRGGADYSPGALNCSAYLRSQEHRAGFPRSGPARFPQLMTD
jgi:hypothetical protein